MLNKMVATLIFGCALGTSIAGCAGEESAEPSTPLTLSFLENTPTRVAGTLTDNEVSIDFAVERHGDAHRAVVRTATGRELLDSVITGHVEDLSIFGGRLWIRGDVHSVEPEVLGDQTALDDLRLAPEHPLTMRLLETLRTRGVDSSLLAPDSPWSSAPEIAPMAAGNFNVWYTLSPSEQRDFATWSFWIPTYIQANNLAGTNASVQSMCSFSTEVHGLMPYGWAGWDVRCGGIRVFVRNVSYDTNAWVQVRVQ
jgi:hypothetical protein